jgi:hemoglobin-like flavoprotein
MTPVQIRLVRNSFDKIEPISSQVGAVFYNKLFEMAPETRSLFSPEMSLQHAKFMSVVKELVSLHLRSLISLPVTLLNNSEAAMPAIHMLGKRHTQFGVSVAHFDLMRKALMDTLTEILGAEFTNELREAWLEAFDVMANVMKKGLLDKEPSGPQFLDRLSEAEENAQKAPATEFFNAASKQEVPQRDTNKRL